MLENNYTGALWNYCKVIVKSCLLSGIKIMLLLVVINSLIPLNANAGVIGDGGNDANPLAYDEIPVHVVVPGYKMFYLDAIYTHNKLLYINVEDLFRTLNIACKSDPAGNSLSGFIENESKTYTINYVTGELKVGNQVFSSVNGLIKESGAYFVESSLFTKAFGMSLGFNFRAMTLTLKPGFELPAVKQMRIEQMRNNLAKVQGREVADTVLGRNYHLFKFGTLDWLVNTSQTSGEVANNHFGLGVGTELLYGEADVSLNYYNRYKFNDRQLQYLWRWVDNQNKIIRQAQVGKISTQTISFINSPVIGAVVRNSPTTIRKATGYYAIHETTEPNWTVELYINNVLIDYTRADASGAYTFNVPVVYGYNTLKLKFYGLMGEERTDERTINMPYTIMQQGEFEYSLSAGMVQDSSYSRLGKGEFNYGVNRKVTLGGGLEYLSSIPNGPFIPYAKATFQPFNKLTINGEYAYGVRSSGLLNYYFGKDALLEINYTKYVDGQLATRFNADVERKARLSFPLRYKKVNGFARLDYTQLDYHEFKYNQANAMLSVYYKQFNASSSTQLNWLDQQKSYVTQDVALSIRFRKGLLLRTSARYNVNQKSVMSYKAEVEKRISIGYISASYERNYTFNDHFVNVSFRFDLPFARAAVSTSHSNGKLTTSQSAMGSLAFGADKHINVSNNPSMSKGGILLYPFLDLNQNGVYDKGEPLVKIKSAKIGGGRIQYSENDSVLRITDLNAFTSYRIEFSDKDLQTISWKFKNKIYQVMVDPNQFKRVEVPVIVVGEISGMVYNQLPGELKGLGRIIIRMYHKNSNLPVTETLSESDGYIYYLGLAPGQYVARPDSAQMQNLGLKAQPAEIPFTIHPSLQGDMVSGIDFTLHASDENVPLQNAPVAPPKPVSPAAADSTQGNILPAKPGQPEIVNQEPAAFPLAQNRDTVVTAPQKPLRRADVDLMTQKQNVVHALPAAPGEMPLQTREVKTAFNNPQFLADTISEPVVLTDKSSTAVEKTMQTDAIITEIPAAIDSSEVAVNKAVAQNEQQVIRHEYLETIPPDTLFKVQLLALSKPIKDKNYFNTLKSKIPGLTIEEKLGEDGLYHYSTGTFKGIREAAKYQRMIAQSGWKDSFVAKYAGEKRTEKKFRNSNMIKKNAARPVSSPSQALSNVNQQPIPKREAETRQAAPYTAPYAAIRQGEVIPVDATRTSFNVGDTLYEVQLLALRSPIKINNYFALLLSKMPGLNIRETLGEDGFYRYSTETFGNKEKARDFNALIRKNGWVDSFITTYYVNSKREILKLEPADAKPEANMR